MLRSHMMRSIQQEGETEATRLFIPMTANSSGGTGYNDPNFYAYDLTTNSNISTGLSESTTNLQASGGYDKSRNIIAVHEKNGVFRAYDGTTYSLLGSAGTSSTSGTVYTSCLDEDRGFFYTFADKNLMVYDYVNQQRTISIDTGIDSVVLSCMYDKGNQTLWLGDASGFREYDLSGLTIANGGVLANWGFQNATTTGSYCLGLALDKDNGYFYSNKSLGTRAVERYTYSTGSGSSLSLDAYYSIGYDPADVLIDTNNSNEIIITTYNRAGDLYKHSSDLATQHVATVFNFNFNTSFGGVFDPISGTGYTPTRQPVYIGKYDAGSQSLSNLSDFNRHMYFF